MGDHPLEAIGAWLGDWWAFLLFVGGMIASHVRLQMQTTSNADNIDRLERRVSKQREEDLRASTEALKRIDEKLERLVTHLLSNKD